jgi:hypothetical protein
VVKDIPNKYPPPPNKQTKRGGEKEKKKGRREQKENEDLYILGCPLLFRVPWDVYLIIKRIQGRNIEARFVTLSRAGHLPSLP